MFLRSPAVRELAGKAADGKISGCAAVGNGFDDARRDEGEPGEVSIQKSGFASQRGEHGSPPSARYLTIEAKILMRSDSE
jgi:hypothetical protein